jgi:small neutral amino acid transporter SnatA (MarC family)
MGRGVCWALVGAQAYWSVSTLDVLGESGGKALARLLASALCSVAVHIEGDRGLGVSSMAETT